MEFRKSTTDRGYSMCKGPEAETRCHANILKMQGNVHVLMLSRSSIIKKDYKIMHII